MAAFPCSLEALATLLDATLWEGGPGYLEPITGLAGLEHAQPGQLSYFADRRYARALRATRASAVLLEHPVPGLTLAQLLHPDPGGAFVTLLEHFHPAPCFEPSVHATAVIASSAHLGEDVHVGPLVVIGEDARIGAHSVLEAHCVVGPEVVVGEHCHLYPRVTVLTGCQLGARVTVHSGTVIGADGFGYRWNGQAHRKVPQLGIVRIEDDVEIGAGCAIDRGTLGETVIGTGSKLDNLVHVGHNAQIGPHCLLIAQVGISGSVKLGRGVVLAGQVGVSDHSEVGDGAVVVAKSGVHGRVAAGSVMAGNPIMPHRIWRRVSAALPRLPELLRRSRLKD